MFIGHYGVSLAVKKKENRIPLWMLFVAVQWVDILFFSFVLVGIEHLRFVPGITAYNSFDLYHMPYTHSLVGSLACSILFGLGAAAFLGKRIPFLRAALWLSIAGFSHFFLDLPMHIPDLQLAPGSDLKFGFGLWNHFYLSMAVEALVLIAGLWFFGAKKRNIRFWALFAILAIMLVATPFMPLPSDPTEAAATALLGYALFAFLAYWAEPDVVS